ncbi:MAG TPA: uracil-DNA glycosylase [Polyangia bacterium]|nr:uracil-DNA glycosylase [Polyangia bacterium]
MSRIRTHLDMRGRSGLLGVVAAPKKPAAAAATSPQKAAPAATRSAPAVRAPADAVVAVSPAPDTDGGEPAAPRGAAALQVVRDHLGDCQRCKLAPQRTNLVFGVGNPLADLIFVGEAPGADEDAQGEPFVGKAGQLLTKMIEAMGYTRQDVYICNVLKCRPPGNRNPEPDEVAACEPFLKRQLAAIRPRMIVALGKFAVQCLLRDESPISRLRGNFRTYEGIPLMPTFHPAYLLRDPSKKKLAWQDLKDVNAALARVGVMPPNPPAA